MVEASSLGLAMSSWELTIVGIPVTVALAAVAAIGYVFGRRSRRTLLEDLDERRRRELDRAAEVAQKLESIADSLRHDLATHHGQISSFKQRLRKVSLQHDPCAWQSVCAEAEALLAPTMQFAHQLSHAYDQIRQQSGALETFTQGRTDPLTGVGNSRALERHLQVLLGAHAKGSAGFVVALISLDRSTGSACAAADDQLPMLSKLAGIIRACMRDSDFAARLGDGEFVVVMPQTSVAGAERFGDRLRQRVVEEVSATVSLGITEACPKDSPKTLLARADSALYSAKAAGTSRMFVHTGTQIRDHYQDISTTPGTSPSAPTGDDVQPPPTSDCSPAERDETSDIDAEHALLAAGRSGQSQ